jgi:hypothetical protein
MSIVRVGKCYKVKGERSMLIENGIIKVQSVEDDTVHYKYLSVNGVVHPKKGNDYAQDISHFEEYTTEMTELEEALL